MAACGYGIFSWNGSERRTSRYGAFTLTHTTYNQDVHVVPKQDALDAFIGKRVKITCVVVESRESGHAGDRFINVFPEQPTAGERIELGVGILQHEPLSWNELGAIVLAPNDGRETFWIDPKRLYRLHDQTVVMVIEQTDEDFSPAVDYAISQETAIANGDGSVQFRNVDPSRVKRIRPIVERIEPGLFTVHNHYAAGEAVVILDDEGRPV